MDSRERREDIMFHVREEMRVMDSERGLRMGVRRDREREKARRGWVQCGWRSQINAIVLFK
jgi:hypothetical protein